MPFTQPRFTTPRSDQTPVPGSALQRHLRGASTDHDPLPPQGLPFGQTLVQELPQAPTPEQPAVLLASPGVDSSERGSQYFGFIQADAPFTFVPATVNERMLRAIRQGRKGTGAEQESLYRDDEVAAHLVHTVAD